MSLGLLDYRPKSFIYVILELVICMCFFLLLVRGAFYVFFYFIGLKLGLLVRT